MEQPSIPVAVVAGLVASLVFGMAGAPLQGASDAASAASLAPAASTPACMARTSARSAAAPAVPPAGPIDRQMDIDGMNRAGGVSTMPDRARGDPCTTARVRAANKAPAPGASDVVRTPR